MGERSSPSSGARAAFLPERRCTSFQLWFPDPGWLVSNCLPAMRPACLAVLPRSGQPFGLPVSWFSRRARWPFLPRSPDALRPLAMKWSAFGALASQLPARVLLSSQKMLAFGSLALWLSGGTYVSSLRGSSLRSPSMPYALFAMKLPLGFASLFLLGFFLCLPPSSPLLFSPFFFHFNTLPHFSSHKTQNPLFHRVSHFSPPYVLQYFVLLKGAVAPLDPHRIGLCKLAL